MRITLVVLLAISLLGADIALSQYRKIEIGEALGEISFDQLLNSKKPIITHQDFKEKVVIFSFWSTYCSTCIADMPKMEALQRKFGNQLMILLISDQPRAQIEEFWKHNHITKTISLPTVVEDERMQQHFEHFGVPYEVWLDPKGIVRGKTTGQYVNEKNIQALLDGKKVDWPVKKNLQAKYDFKKPMLQNTLERENERRSKYIVSILPSIKGIIQKFASGHIKDSLTQTGRFYAINYSILDLYRSVLSSNPSMGNARNRILVKSKDSSRFFYDREKTYLEDWREQHNFCLEVVYPLTSPWKQMQGKLLADLNMAFNLEGRMEKTEVDCWIIEKMKDAKQEPQLYSGKLQRTVFGDIATLVNAVNYQTDHIPLLDESGVHDQLRIQLSNGFNSFEDLKADLRRYGLDLKRGKRMLDMFVLIEQ